MLDFDYLAKGLCAMARAHRVNTMSGHLGAAVAAGYFIGVQHQDLDAEVSMAIAAELERIIHGESVFSPRGTTGIGAAEMFEPFAEEQPETTLIDSIADALAHTLGDTRESGHNVIFAAIAIRALKDHPDLATPAVVDGIRRLIMGFSDAPPGSGYYGRSKGRINGRMVPLPKDDTFPPYPDLEVMANTVFDELIRHAAERRDGFGGLWHVINHAAGLVELDRYGYRELALKGLPAHHRHLSLLRTLPNVSDEFGAETPTEDDPFTPIFWRPDRLRGGRAHLTHRIKTLYGFHVLAERVESDLRRGQAKDSLRYLL